MRVAFPVLACVLAASQSAGAQAIPVTLVGTVVNTCILTVSTPGVLAPSSDGTVLSSSELTGVKAIMAIVSTGNSPSISFTAPTLTGPSSSVAGASKTIAYSSPGGASQAATSGTYTYLSNRLLDTVTIDARAQNSQGFASGTYTIGTTATCQQQ